MAASTPACRACRGRLAGDLPPLPAARHRTSAPPSRPTRPGAVTWAAVSIADKLDTVVGCSPQESARPAPATPSASGARRRAAADPRRLAGTDGLERPCRGSHAGAGQAGVGDVAAVTEAPDSWRDAVTVFLIDRLRYLFEQRGFAYDELNAVVGRVAGVPDPLDSRRRLEALRGVRASADFEAWRSRSGASRTSRVNCRARRPNGVDRLTSRRAGPPGEYERGRRRSGRPRPPPLR